MKEQNLNKPLNSALHKTAVSRSFFGRSSFPKLKWEKTWKYFQVNLFSDTKFRVSIYISKFRKERLHFCMILGSLITLDTAHLGKRICGRLHLTRFLGKDFHVYSSGDSGVTQNCG